MLKYFPDLSLEDDVPTCEHRTAERMRQQEQGCLYRSTSKPGLSKRVTGWRLLRQLPKQYPTSKACQKNPSVNLVSAILQSREKGKD